VAFVPYDIGRQSFWTPHRVAHLRRVLAWLARGKQPGFVEGGAWLIPQFLTDGRIFRAVVWNAGFDPVEKVTLHPPSGWPKLGSRISYDNTKIAVAQIIGAHLRKLTAAFGRLVGHYLFEPHFCRIRRANEKGVVEGAVRYSRQNFLVPVPQVADWAQLNAHLLTCCRSDMTRRLWGKTLSKGQLLEEDKVAGLVIPADRFDPRRLKTSMKRLDF
jgi:hypothetical protein